MPRRSVGGNSTQLIIDWRVIVVSEKGGRDDWFQSFSRRHLLTRRGHVKCGRSMGGNARLGFDRHDALVIEGRKREHERSGDQWTDLVIGAIYRTPWRETAAKLWPTLTSAPATGVLG